MIAPRSVLIVDRENDTPDVLRTILERQGVEVISARFVDEGLSLAREKAPDLVVLAEPTASSESSDSDRFEAEMIRQQTPLILVGRFVSQPLSGKPGEFMRKPYDYRPLIQKIEQVLADLSKQRSAISRHAA